VFAQGFAKLAIFFDTPPALEDFLRVGLVVPEIGCGRLRF
jgi:hypothetical protein